MPISYRFPTNLLVALLVFWVFVLFLLGFLGRVDDVSAQLQRPRKQQREDGHGTPSEADKRNILELCQQP